MNCPKSCQCPMPARYGAPHLNPIEGIEGNPKNPVWVIGINQKTEWKQHIPPVASPTTWRSDKTDRKAPHFRRLEQVLGAAWSAALLRDGGIAHTDIVKCGSPGVTPTEREAVAFCQDFLVEQVRAHEPKLLLVVSSAASEFVANQARLPPLATEGEWRYGPLPRQTCYVVLSGYTGPRQDRFAKRRLSQDFLAACERCQLAPPAPGLSAANPPDLSDAPDQD